MPQTNWNMMQLYRLFDREIYAQLEEEGNLPKGAEAGYSSFNRPSTWKEEILKRSGQLETKVTTRSVEINAAVSTPDHTWALLKKAVNIHEQQQVDNYLKVRALTETSIYAVSPCTCYMLCMTRAKNQVPEGGRSRRQRHRSLPSSSSRTRSPWSFGMWCLPRIVGFTSIIFWSELSTGSWP
jgi:hypothetical protein